MLLTSTEFWIIKTVSEYRILDLEVKKMDSIKERVGAYLERTGKTKKELSGLMGMPYSTFHSKLYGPSEFTFFEGKKLAEIIGCTADEMFESPFASA